MSIEELRAAEAAVAACRRAAARAEHLAETIVHEQHACRRLRERLTDERDDVAALEKTSVSSLLAKVRGRFDDELRAERDEVAAAEVELATQQSALARLTAEFESARDEALGLDDALARLEEVTAARERQLVAQDSGVAHELAVLDQRLAAERAARTEIVEAHHAAIGADGAIERAIEVMTSARNWSAHDTFLGGEWLSSTVKQHRLDSSVELMAEVHAALIKLRTELGELAASVHHPNLSQPSPRLLTLDRWFDNIASDVLVHHKILRSLDQLRRSHDGVRELLGQLAAEERIATARVAELEAHRDRLLRH